MAVHLVNIDWLSVYGLHNLQLTPHGRASGGYVPPEGTAPDVAAKGERMFAEGVPELTAAGMQDWFVGDFRLVPEEYGTRHYILLYKIYKGRELFGNVQLLPRSPILPRNSAIIKVANKWLYCEQWRAEFRLLAFALSFEPKSISRLDVCADFNHFECGLHPRELIAQFCRGELRHKGRGVGHVDFVQSPNSALPDGSRGYAVTFNALTFGTHQSDTHVYLYNKTHELEVEKNKEYIRDAWRAVGLDETEVWRLEVSTKEKGLHYVDAATGEAHDVSVEDVLRDDWRKVIFAFYYDMVRALFFFYYPSGKKNVSREVGIVLFSVSSECVRRCVHKSELGGRREKILIRNLYLFPNLYPQAEMVSQMVTPNLATEVANMTGLQDWYAVRSRGWDKLVNAAGRVNV